MLRLQTVTGHSHLNFQNLLLVKIKATVNIRNQESMRPKTQKPINARLFELKVQPLSVQILRCSQINFFCKIK